MPQTVCNFLTTFSRVLWTEPLNLNLRMTSHGEERIPFHFYVQPCASLPSSFPQFDKLPAELQLHILSFCSAPTLFHVMHVSSTLRLEATKLFWRDPNTYYIINSHWIFNGTQPSDAYYELAFLEYVQNVELENLDEVLLRTMTEGTWDVSLDRAQNFWDNLRSRFPRVKRVVVTVSFMGLSGWLNDHFSAYMKLLLKPWPPGIDVSVNVTEQETSISEDGQVTWPANGLQRSSYQYTLDGEWRKLTPCVDRKSILMPVKPFYGPVGEFSRFIYAGDKIMMEDYGLWFLAIGTVDRHHFDGKKQESFSCPEFGCDAFFEESGQFMLHVIRRHRPSCLDRPLPLDLLPERLRNVFEERMKDLRNKSEELKRDCTRMSREWNEEGPEKRRDIESAWIDQLENDEVWGSEEASMSMSWVNFKRVMDPTFPGY